MNESLTLLELNQQIKDGLKNSLPDNYWVIAEVSELKVNRRGHCYLDLIEKDELEDKIIAKARGIIWAGTFRMLQPYFQSETGKDLKEGLKILVLVSVEFHELYGLSLQIFDIDPTYTLGDLARKRMETIKRLEQEGIFNMNKDLPFPLVPQKIAVISSATAAGYSDFMEHLNQNPYGYVFYPKLFPAYMQGDQAEESIIRSLEKIYTREKFFDAVAIIRGGGAQSDLSCFDLYHLAANIAQFPLPVITGIGHEKDESVVDLVANTKQKTPTAVADFLVSQIYNFEQQLMEYRDSFVEQVQNYIKLENQKVINISHRIIPASKNVIEHSKNKISLIKSELKSHKKYYFERKKNNIQSKNQHLQNLSSSKFKQINLYLDLYKQNLRKYVQTYIEKQSKKIENFSKAKDYLDPQNILKRGFSITKAGDKIIKDAKDVKEGQTIETYLNKGKLESKITKKTLTIKRLFNQEN
jgi:exodeoxyribonuclease VII large subunit